MTFRSFARLLMGLSFAASAYADTDKISCVLYGGWGEGKEIARKLMNPCGVDSSNETDATRLIGTSSSGKKIAFSISSMERIYPRSPSDFYRGNVDEYWTWIDVDGSRLLSTAFVKASNRVRFIVDGDKYMVECTDSESVIESSYGVTEPGKTCLKDPKPVTIGNPKEAAARAFSSAECVVTGDIPMITVLSPSILREDGFFRVPMRDTDDELLVSGSLNSTNHGILFAAIVKKGAPAPDYEDATSTGYSDRTVKDFPGFAKAHNMYGPTLERLTLETGAVGQTVRIRCVKKI